MTLFSVTTYEKPLLPETVTSRLSREVHSLVNWLGKSQCVELAIKKKFNRYVEKLNQSPDDGSLIVEFSELVSNWVADYAEQAEGVLGTLREPLRDFHQSRLGNPEYRLDTINSLCLVDYTKLEDELAADFRARLDDEELGEPFELTAQAVVSPESEVCKYSPRFKFTSKGAIPVVPNEELDEGIEGIFSALTLRA